MSIKSVGHIEAEITKEVTFVYSSQGEDSSFGLTIDGGDSLSYFFDKAGAAILCEALNRAFTMDKVVCGGPDCCGTSGCKHG